eukprot:354058-Chlamydomonas_euryale.AAC.4
MGAENDRQSIKQKSLNMFWTSEAGGTIFWKSCGLETRAAAYNTLCTTFKRQRSAAFKRQKKRHIQVAEDAPHSSGGRGAAFKRRKKRHIEAAEEAPYIQAAEETPYSSGC